VIDDNNPPEGKAAEKAPDPKQAERKKDAALEGAPELKDVELPFQAAWDTGAFRTYFTIEKATFDVEKKELSWLVKARRGFINNEVWGDTKLDVDFLDAENVRLHRMIHNTVGGLKYNPEIRIKQGDPIRITLHLPDQMVLAKTAKVVIVDPNKAVPKKKK